MEQRCLLCQSQIDSQISIQNIISIITRPVPNICGQCQNQFNEINPGCQTCYKMGQFKNNQCDDCCVWSERKMKLQNQSLYQYNEFMKQYMHQYKFMGDYRLRNVFKKQFDQRVRALAKHRLIVPIPVSKETFDTRGFNQVTGWLDVNYVEVLMTNKKVRQSRLNRLQRLSIEQPFTIHPDWHMKITGKDILLIDDIYTTGTTVHLATQKLIEAGCRSVISFTLAR